MNITQQEIPATQNTISTNQQAKLDERAINVLLKKIDLHLLPLLILLYFFSFLDRISIGYAYKLGLENYLHLSPFKKDWTTLIFYITYISCAVPSSLLMRVFTPSKWIPTLMFMWGIITILTMLVQSYSGLLVARFFLGVAEAGFFPGVCFYLSLWYIRKDQALRIGILMSGAAFACASDGILAYGIAQIDIRESLNKWRWLFLAEGVPTICIAIASYKLLTNPTTVRCEYHFAKKLFIASTNKGLDQCSKDILTARLLADAKIIGNDTLGSLSHQIRSICFDLKVWLYVFIYMGATTTVYGINLFLPPIVDHMSSVNDTNNITKLLSGPPYLTSGLTTIISTWNAGRLNERSNHIMVLLLIEIIGFIYLVLAETYLYIGAMFVGVGVFSSNALILSWVTNNIGDPTKRVVVLALVNGFGNIGAIISERIYPQSSNPIHNKGHWIVIGILCVTCILVLLLKLLLKYENRRDRHIIMIQLQVETAAVETQTKLSRHPDFVYVT